MVAKVIGLYDMPGDTCVVCGIIVSKIKAYPCITFLESLEKWIKALGLNEDIKDHH